jgi:hypothetical protein
MNLIDSVDYGMDLIGNRFVYILGGLYLLPVIIFTGIIRIDIDYVYYYNLFVQIFVCIFLVIRFNPLRQATLKAYDQRIIFSSAIFLLFNLGTFEILKKILIRTKIPYLESTVKQYESK